METVVNSAGGSVEDSKIKFPAFISDMIGSDATSEMNTKLLTYSVNPEAAGVFSFYNDNITIIVAGISNSDKLNSSLANDGYKEKDEEDGITYFCKENEYSSSYAAVNDDYAYFCNLGGTDMNAGLRKFKRSIAQKDDHNFKSTSFGKYIADANGAGISVRIPSEVADEMKGVNIPSAYLDLLKGVVCAKIDITENALDCEMKLFDLNGHERDNSLFDDIANSKAHINPDALKYFTANEQLVMAVELKDLDWDKYIDNIADAGAVSLEQKAALSMAKSYLEKLDGTMAFGLGLSNGLTSVAKLTYQTEPMRQVVSTIVLETKEGKAKSLFNDMKSFAEATDVDVTTDNGGITMNLGPEAGEIHIKAIDNFFIISTHPIRESDGCEAVSNFDFADHLAAVVLYLSKGSKLMTDLGLPYDACLSISSNPDKNTMNIHFEMKGGKSDEGVIAKICRAARDLVSNEKKIEKTFESARPNIWYGASGTDDTADSADY